MTTKAEPRVSPQELEEHIISITEKLVENGYRTREEIQDAIDSHFKEKEIEQEKQMHKPIGEVESQ